MLGITKCCKLEKLRCVDPYKEVDDNDGEDFQDEEVKLTRNKRKNRSSHLIEEKNTIFDSVGGNISKGERGTYVDDLFWENVVTEAKKQKFDESDDEDDELEISMFDMKATLDSNSDAYFVLEEEMKKHDPVTPYGPGILSYFSLQERLLRVFAVLSLMAIPILIVYC